MHGPIPLPTLHAPTSNRPPVPPAHLVALAFAVTLVLLVQSTPAHASHPWVTEYIDSTSCTRCHSTAAHEVMSTSHWTWNVTNAVTGQALGKNNVINNYCIALPSNEPRCTSCHVGIGYANGSFDFSDARKVDCLVCHDTTGTYRKFPTGAGAPVTGTAKEFPAGSGNFWPPVDLLHVARNVGPTSRATCGACHFYGGGDDAVKHGDLDSTLAAPTRDVDVHMAREGLNFSCSQCHETHEHQIPGSRYAKTHGDDLLCQRCHSNAPHAKTVPALDAHVARVACQTCHVPTFARGNKATKMSWNWSTAGKKDANGKNYVVRNAEGEVIYDTQKGDFVWERDVVPEYVWFNGGATYATLDDPVDPAVTLPINRLHGSFAEASSKLFPIKRFSAIQPFDAGQKTLAVPHLFPTSATDTNAYWKVFDWNKALSAGMQAVGRSYSGSLGWVKTEMSWIQNHMIAPKEKALRCVECHAPDGRLDFAALGYAPERASRLQTLAGFELAGIERLTHPSGLRLRWLAQAGFAYRVQASADLILWHDVPEAAFPAAAAAAELAWNAPIPDTGAARFFRVLRHQP